MTDVLTELIDLLTLQDLGGDRFRGRSRDLGWGRLFGGHVLSQALSAAAETVDETVLVHSLHSYFLRAGAVDAPIEYVVDRIRDGRSFSTRRVVAWQNGRPIFNLAASFHGAEPGFEHQDSMPDAPAPETLPSELELARMVADILPEKLRARALNERPIEVRPINPTNPMRPTVGPSTQMVWYRAVDTLPDDPALHRHLLAYASDFNFLGTAIQPHGVSWLTPGIRMASLDHSMWFHRPFRLDDWLLYSVDSPVAAGGRALVRGQFFTRDGTLVASTTQEGVIRMDAWRDTSGEGGT